MKASIIILTYNQLEQATRPCVESLFKNTPMDDFELIAVDNASTDGTVAFLKSLQEEYSNVRLCLNSQNRGYAGGNNDGIRLASGDCIVLLNNDTLAPPGWLDALLAPLADPQVGLVGPVTNSSGNEQMVVLPSLTEENYESVTAPYTQTHRNVCFSSDRLGFFCVAMRRKTQQQIGLLDERFGIGMFEDDDYCRRAIAAGYRCLVNEGCFVYHKGSLSFKQLDSKLYAGLFEKNRALLAEKHHEEWLFNDLALAFWNKLKFDFDGHCAHHALSPDLERIAVRIGNFRDLLRFIRDNEQRQRTTLLAQERELESLRIQLSNVYGSKAWWFVDHCRKVKDGLKHALHLVRTGRALFALHRAIRRKTAKAMTKLCKASGFSPKTEETDATLKVESR